MLEVVDDTFAVEEVHRGSQEVPVVPESVRSGPYGMVQDYASYNITASLTYQFKDFVNLRLLALLGTFEIAMT